MKAQEIVEELNDDLYTVHGDKNDMAYSYVSTGYTEAILYEGICVWHCQDDLTENGEVTKKWIRTRLKDILAYALK